MSPFDIQIATKANSLPSEEDFEEWITTTLAKQNLQGTLSIRIVDEAEMTDLNSRFRQKAKPTNVLSFPCPVPFKNSGILGDIVICAPVIAEEAFNQQKEPLAHWAHMIIHGILHLTGHDHVKPEEAKIMEDLEIEILQSLGFNNPYRENG